MLADGSHFLAFGPNDKTILFGSNNLKWHTDEDIDLEDMEIDDIEMKVPDEKKNKVAMVRLRCNASWLGFDSQSEILHSLLLYFRCCLL